MSDWHGWKRADGPALHIGELPGRKSVVLYKIDGSVLTPLAYFRSVEGAEDALSILDDLVVEPVDR